MALPRNNRLKRKRDFDAVFRNGRAVNGTFLFIKTAPVLGSAPKLGVVVSSRVAKTSVMRNHIRRIITEAVRSRFLSANPAYAMVIVVTRAAPDDGSLRADLATVLQKTHL